MATVATTTFVVNLDRVDASMLATVGGKAANLGEMIRAGLPVPPGVCVTTDAYRMVVARGALDGVLDELDAVAADDVELVEDTVQGAPRNDHAVRVRGHAHPGRDGQTGADHFPEVGRLAADGGQHGGVNAV